jgi:hypothetical protein
MEAHKKISAAIPSLQTGLDTGMSSAHETQIGKS